MKYESAKWEPVHISLLICSSVSCQEGELSAANYWSGDEISRSATVNFRAQTASEKIPDVIL